MKNMLEWMGRVTRVSTSTPGDGDCGPVAFQQTRQYYQETSQRQHRHADILASSQSLCATTRRKIHDAFYTNSSLRTFLTDEKCADALR